MDQARRVSLYSFLAPIGIMFVLFLPVPLSIASLSSLEPVLLLILLAVWTVTYLLRATFASRAKVEAAAPVFRSLLHGRNLIADLLRISIFGVALVIVWLAWSSQPYRIFNATLLGSAWGGVEVVNSLLRFRGPDSNYAVLSRIDEKSQ